MGGGSEAHSRRGGFLECGAGAGMVAASRVLLLSGEASCPEQSAENGCSGPAFVFLDVNPL